MSKVVSNSPVGRVVTRVAIVLGLLAATLGTFVAAETVTAPVAGANTLVRYEDFYISSSNNNYAIRFAYWVNPDTNYFTVVADRYDRNWVYQGREVDLYFQDTLCPYLNFDNTYGYYIRYLPTIDWDTTWTCQYPPRTQRNTNHADSHDAQFYDFWCYFSCSLTGTHGYVTYGYWAPMRRGVYGGPITQLY